MQAITWLANNHPDLILLDYEMPVTSGPKVLEMIRSDVATADIPVMFLTGKGDKDSVIRVMQLRPVGYQLKSIDRATLRDNIAKFFASHNAG
jgi:CheY-like chemotaxis protein